MVMILQYSWLMHKRVPVCTSLAKDVSVISTREDTVNDLSIILRKTLLSRWLSLKASGLPVVFVRVWVIGRILGSQANRSLEKV